jgi:hypothetical protein
MDAHRAAEASLDRSLASVRRAITILRRVVDQNKALGKVAGHEASARQRLREANAELRELRRQEVELERRVAARTEGS